MQNLHFVKKPSKDVSAILRFKKMNVPGDIGQNLEIHNLSKIVGLSLVGVRKSIVLIALLLVGVRQDGPIGGFAEKGLPLIGHVSGIGHSKCVHMPLSRRCHFRSTKRMERSTTE